MARFWFFPCLSPNLSLLWHLWPEPSSVLALLLGRRPFTNLCVIIWGFPFLNLAWAFLNSLSSRPCSETLWTRFQGFLATWWKDSISSSRWMDLVLAWMSFSCSQWTNPVSTWLLGNSPTGIPVMEAGRTTTTSNPYQCPVKTQFT